MADALDAKGTQPSTLIIQELVTSVTIVENFCKFYER